MNKKFDNDVQRNANLTLMLSQIRQCLDQNQLEFQSSLKRRSQGLQQPPAENETPSPNQRLHNYETKTLYGQSPIQTDQDFDVQNFRVSRLSQENLELKIELENLKQQVETTQRSANPQLQDKLAQLEAEHEALRDKYEKCKFYECNIYEDKQSLLNRVDLANDYLITILMQAFSIEDIFEQQQSQNNSTIQQQELNAAPFQSEGADGRAQLNQQGGTTSQVLPNPNIFTIQETSGEYLDDTDEIEKQIRQNDSQPKKAALLNQELQF